MTIYICPRCNRRFVVDFGVTDFEHECDSRIPAIDNEDIVVIGGWSDYTGSEAVNKAEVMFAGIVNAVQGQRAGVEGEDVEDLTERGKRKSTHRSRQHLEYIDLKNG